MSDKLREAAKAALDWLKDKRLDTWAYMESSKFYSDRHKQTKALEAALAEPAIKESLTVQRPWVGLTENEIWTLHDFDSYLNPVEFARAIEAKLREKNR